MTLMSGLVFFYRELCFFSQEILLKIPCVPKAVIATLNRETIMAAWKV
jgi:hypothetical protein